MKEKMRKVGDLVNILGTDRLGIILKVHEKAGATRFYLVHDNVSNEKRWLHENAIYDSSCLNPNVELLREL